MAKILTAEQQWVKPRLLSEVVAVLAAGGVVILPSDGGYALFSGLEHKATLQRLRALGALQGTEGLTLVCADLAMVSAYAQLTDAAFGLLKRLPVGAVTAILPATRQTPKWAQEAKRKTVAVTMTSQVLLLALIEQLGAPLLQLGLGEADEAVLANQVDLWVDVGALARVEVSVVDFAKSLPEVVYQGAQSIDL